MSNDRTNTNIQAYEHDQHNIYREASVILAIIISMYTAIER